jgi:DNA-binding NarL/FixJ family response regulator
MAIAVADLSHLAASSAAAPGKTIRLLLVHGCPLFRVGLCSLLAQQDECDVVGEATQLEEVLVLVREQRPDVVLLDGSLTATDPLDLVQQLRLMGVPGILVFAPPGGDEETLFRFLMSGATAYEESFISGEELLAKMHRVARGECLVTGDVLLAQAARRSRLARLRRAAFLAPSLAKARLPAQQEEDSQCPATEVEALLSARERAVLEHIARGGTNAQVAQAIGISYHTVKNHLDEIYRKLQVPDRTSAVIMAIRKRWIVIDGIHSPSL